MHGDEQESSRKRNIRPRRKPRSGATIFLDFAGSMRCDVEDVLPQRSESCPDKAGANCDQRNDSNNDCHAHVRIILSLAEIQDKLQEKVDCGRADCYC